MIPEPVVVPGERIFEYVTAADQQPYGIAIAEIMASQPHRHDRTRECYTLLRGRLEVFLKIGGEAGSAILSRFGDNVVIPIGATHWARSLGDRPAIVAVASTPAWTPEDHHLVATE